jgi:hypothetical protein
MKFIERLKNNLWQYVPIQRSTHLKKEAKEAEDFIGSIAMEDFASKELRSYCESEVRGLYFLDVFYALIPIVNIVSGFYFKYKEGKIRSYATEGIKYGRIAWKHRMNPQKKLARGIWKNTKRKPI